jgi:hypothetical protein
VVGSQASEPRGLAMSLQTRQALQDYACQCRLSPGPEPRGFLGHCPGWPILPSSSSWSIATFLVASAHLPELPPSYRCWPPPPDKTWPTNRSRL